MSKSRYSMRFNAQLLLVVLCGLMTSASDCVFPTFMTRASRWETLVTSERRRIGAMWTFPTPSQAHLLNIMARSKTIFNCHTVINDETFLASITKADVTTSRASTSYQCLRFIRRSDFVVQLANSTVFSTISPDHCLDSAQLQLQHWVLVWPRSGPGAPPGDVISCGMVGGYWLSVVDSSGSDVCRQSFLRPIIEADCAVPGEGVLIDFRQLTCAIKSLSGTDASHQLVCLGSWTQFGSIFSVLTDNRIFPRLWMMRIPEAASGPITAYLMTSLSTGISHNTTADQYPLRLTRASFTTLCEDEASTCDVTQCDDDPTEVHCQKACNACAVATGGFSCKFNESDLGEWLEASHRYVDNHNSFITVTVTNTTVQVGVQPAWHCIVFSAQHRYSSSYTADTKRRPVAMLFEETGCRPRLACLEVISRSDAVIEYRIGRQVTWPVTSEATSDVVCSDEMFTEQIGTDSPQSVQYRSLVSRQHYSTSAVDCEIDAWFHFNGSNSTGQQLQGYVDACGCDATTFRYVTTMTSSTPNDQPVTSQETHRCLATFTERGSAAIEFTYIITADTGPVSEPTDPPRLLCWLLVKSPWLKNPRLYLLYASGCHTGAGIEVSLRTYTGYIAQFDLVSSETDQEYIRNCSTREQVSVCSTHRKMPVTTPGRQQTRSAMHIPVTTRSPGPGQTAFPIDTDTGGETVLTTAYVAAIGVAIVIVVLIIIFYSMAVVVLAYLR